MTEESILIPSGGLTLEGVLAYDEGSAIEALAVLCPPHPQLMGNMDNNVIRAVSDELAESGWATLRFNYRGVGKSEYPGSDHLPAFEYWEAMMQSKDYGVVLTDFDSVMVIANSLGFEFRRVSIVGYSFGAYIAAVGGCGDTPVSELALISPPFPQLDFSCLARCSKRKLIIAGDSDFVFPDNDFVEQASIASEPKEVVVMPGVDHFFVGKEKEVAQRVREFFVLT